MTIGGVWAFAILCLAALGAVVLLVYLFALLGDTFIPTTYRYGTVTFRRADEKAGAVLTNCRVIAWWRFAIVWWSKSTKKDPS